MNPNEQPTSDSQGTAQSPVYQAPDSVVMPQPQVVQPVSAPESITTPQPVVIEPQQPQVITPVQPAQQVVQPTVPTQQSASATQPVVTDQASTQSYAPVQSASQPVVSSVQQPQSLNSVNAPTQPVADPEQKPKTPLVTLAAQLTFRGNTDQKPKTLVGKIIGVVMVIIAVAGSAGAITAAQHVKAARQEIHEISNPYAAKREDDKKKALKESGPDTQDGKDGKVDVSKLFDATNGQHPQDITGKYNQQINLSDGASFMVTSSERGWSSGNDYDKPAKNKEFIRIDLSTGYRGKEGTAYMSSYDFKLKNSKGGLQDSKSISSASLGENELQNASGSLNPGDTRQGSVIFEIDKGEAVTLVYEKKGYDENSKEFAMRGSVEINK